MSGLIFISFPFSFTSTHKLKPINIAGPKIYLSFPLNVYLIASNNFTSAKNQERLDGVTENVDNDAFPPTQPSRPF